MPAISEEEKVRRQRMVGSVNGTHEMEGLFADAETQSIMRAYADGELTMAEFSARMDSYAGRLIAQNRPLAVVA